MWLSCAGSLIPNLFAPDDAGEDAAYGTVGHMVGETWLKNGEKPIHMRGTRHFVPSGDFGFLIEVDDVMFDHVERYVDWCKDLPGDHYVETRVDISCLTPIPNQKGTADHAACMPGRLVITDLKLGKGVRVYANENSQALLYALGFFFEWDWLYDFQEIVIRIAQPRMDVFEEWTVDRKYLLDFAEYVKPRAAAAWVQNAPRTPSNEACQWCRVEGTCGARIKQLFDVSEGVFDTIGKEIATEEVVEFREKVRSDWEFAALDPAKLSPEELERIFSFKDGIDRLWKKMAAAMSQRVAEGLPMKHWKIVEGRSFRAFRNKKSAGERLIELGCKREEVFATEIVSPAAAEELLRKAGHKSKDIPRLLADLVFKPPGKATLVPITDPRPPIGDKSEGVFSDTTLTMEIEE